MESVSQEEVYIVKKGDSLWEICKKYDLNYDWKNLAAYNNIKNPDLIQIGQKIKIPSKKVNQAIIQAEEKVKQLPQIVKNEETEAEKSIVLDALDQLEKGIDFEKVKHDLIQQTVNSLVLEIVENFQSYGVLTKFAICTVRYMIMRYYNRQ